MINILHISVWTHWLSDFESSLSHEIYRLSVCSELRDTMSLELYGMIATELVCLGQVQRNFHHRPAAIGAEASAGDLEEWQQKFASFIQRGRKADKEKAEAKQKARCARQPFNRPASFDLLNSVDHAMTVALQCPLATFQVADVSAPPDSETCGLDKPLLCVVIDQGPDGYAGSWFLQNELKLRMVLIPDMAHREKTTSSWQ